MFLKKHEWGYLYSSKLRGKDYDRLQPVLKEPALMDVNVVHHHVLQWGPETVVGELLIVQRAYYFCSSLDLPAIASGFSLLLQVLPVLAGLIWR